MSINLKKFKCSSFNQNSNRQLPLKHPTRARKVSSRRALTRPCFWALISFGDFLTLWFFWIFFKYSDPTCFYGNDALCSNDANPLAGANNTYCSPHSKVETNQIFIRTQAISSSALDIRSPIAATRANSIASASSPTGSACIKLNTISPNNNNNHNNNNASIEENDARMFAAQNWLYAGQAERVGNEKKKNRIETAMEKRTN